MPCGQIGRLVQMWTSVTSPMTPAWTHSLTSRASSPEWPWLPIWVTTPVRSGDLGQRAGLLDGVGERLLDVDVLARLHRGPGDRGVEVVGGGDEHRVQVGFAVQQFAEVGVLPGLQELLLPAVALLAGVAVAVDEAFLDAPVHDAPVHVADRGDVFGAELLGVLRALTADPDDREVEAVGGRLVAGSAEHVAGNDHGAHGKFGTAIHEVPAVGQAGRGTTVGLVGHEHAPLG